MAGLQKMCAATADTFGGIGKAQPPVRRQRGCGVFVGRIEHGDLPLVFGIAPLELPGEF